jgi:hypothetical protein
MTRGARHFLTSSSTEAAATAAVFRERRNGLGRAIVSNDFMPRAHEPARHVRAHPAKADHSDLHPVEDISVRPADDEGGSKDPPLRRYDTTTAVPLIVTINMLALVPTVLVVEVVMPTTALAAHLGGSGLDLFHRDVARPPELALIGRRAAADDVADAGEEILEDVRRP